MPASSSTTRFISATRLSVLALCSLLFAVAGTFHFLRPELFDKAMPQWIPWHYEMIFATGAIEFFAAFGLLMRQTRRMVGTIMSVFLIAVFPVNINMALNSSLFPSIPVVALWLRLPLQFILIAGLWWCTREAPSSVAIGGDESID